jgi:predicted transcriptional regulator
LVQEWRRTKRTVFLVSIIDITTAFSISKKTAYRRINELIKVKLIKRSYCYLKGKHYHRIELLENPEILNI